MNDEVVKLLEKTQENALKRKIYVRRRILYLTGSVTSLLISFASLGYLHSSSGPKDPNSLPFFVGLYGFLVAFTFIGMLSPRFERRILRMVRTIIVGPLDSEEPQEGESSQRMELALTELRMLVQRMQMDRLVNENPFRPVMTDEVAKQIKEAFSIEAMGMLREQYGIAEVEKSVTGTKTRLNNAVKTLGGRVNQNLWIGVLIASVGCLSLAYFTVNIPKVEGGQVLGTDPQHHLTHQIGHQMLYFLPRLSIVLLVEIFSYFFLSLYRTGLDDLKYYQNELTNIESREAALHASLSKGSEDLLKQVVSALIRTDRNASVRVNAKKRSKEKPKEDSKVALAAISKMESLAKASM